MINTKTNTALKLIFFFGILLVIHACTTRESFTFEKQQLTADKLIDCNDNDCVSVDIDLLKTTDNGPVCKRINTYIELMACAMLNIAQAQPEKTIDAAILQFHKTYQETRKEFPNEIPPYEASISSVLSYQSSDIICIQMEAYVFTGGAHGYGGVNYVNIDAETGNPIPNEELFKDYIKFKVYAEKVFRSKFEILESESINSTGFLFDEEKFYLPRSIGFSDKEVILYYNAFEISSYSQGDIEIKIPKEDVAFYFAYDIL